MFASLKDVKANTFMIVKTGHHWKQVRGTKAGNIELDFIMCDLYGG